MSYPGDLGYYPAPGYPEAPRYEMKKDKTTGKTTFYFPTLEPDDEAAYKRTQRYINWEQMFLSNLHDKEVNERVEREEAEKRKGGIEEWIRKKNEAMLQSMKDWDEDVRKWNEHVEKRNREAKEAGRGKQKKNRRKKKSVEVVEVVEEEEEEVYESYNPSKRRK